MRAGCRNARGRRGSVTAPSDDGRGRTSTRAAWRRSAAGVAPVLRARPWRPAPRSAAPRCGGQQHTVNGERDGGGGGMGGRDTGKKAHRRHTPTQPRRASHARGDGGWGGLARSPGHGGGGGGGWWAKGVAQRARTRGMGAAASTRNVFSIPPHVPPLPLRNPLAADGVRQLRAPRACEGAGGGWATTPFEARSSPKSPSKAASQKGPVSCQTMKRHPILA